MGISGCLEASMRAVSAPDNSTSFLSYHPTFPTTATRPRCSCSARPTSTTPPSACPTAALAASKCLNPQQLGARSLGPCMGVRSASRRAECSFASSVDRQTWQAHNVLDNRPEGSLTHIARYHRRARCMGAGWTLR